MKRENLQAVTGGCLTMTAVVLLVIWFIVSPSGTNAYGLYNDSTDLPQLSGWMSIYSWLDWLIEPVKEGKLEGWQAFYATLGQLSLFVYIAVSAWCGIYMTNKADYRHVWPVAAIVAIAVWTSYLAVYIGYCFVSL